jgi:hypothetical protein
VRSLNADDSIREYLGRKNEQNFDDFSEGEIVDLVIRFGIWPSLDSYTKAPWLARYALRRQRHRVDERAPGEKRDLWGMPDDAGYFADDNSLLKSTFKNMVISGKNNPYGSRKVTSGLVCCHIWPGTTGNPLLFSFLPNLVWVPKSLSRFTDAFQDKPPHKAHFILQKLSHLRYRKTSVLTGKSEVEIAWEKLIEPEIDLSTEFFLNEMNSEPSLSKRVGVRHARLLTFLDAALNEDVTSPRRFSKRYHLGSGNGLDKTVPPITSLVTRDKLIDLRDVIEKTAPYQEN